ncbi:hypothetical protein [Sphingopyxis macrogoltabida]|uniref:Uncharacterized protein n=1 Tax=Sphingopyxis macrogoltabida TaxID=33050 RepID=A0AAC9FGI7_SPHMC|nr:hypothetical protein [Sphingopyxis macrogoltabida]ALJ15336.1 hypothetical protein LH19_20875 [Sphingopyxis macrogoltabida]AMU91586.1 hypothetical protein ATM17_21460 [Sphingopyxis macrogoltabida]
MIRLVSESSPVEIAWANFDAAAIRLQLKYQERPLLDTPEKVADRMAAAQEAARLWDEWRALFLAPSDPGDAA